MIIFQKIKNVVKREVYFLKVAYKVYRLMNTKEETINEEEAYQSGIIQCSELSFLRELVQKSNVLPGPIIEIGTLFGYSTRKIALWKSSSKKFITVDNYSWNPYAIDKTSHFKLTKRILSPLIKSANVIQINMEKNEFYKKYSGEVPAMVFLDANHSYEETKHDIYWAKRVGAKIICGHDYLQAFQEVKRAVDESGTLAGLQRSLWLLSYGGVANLDSCAQIKEVKE